MNHVATFVQTLIRLVAANRRPPERSSLVKLLPIHSLLSVALTGVVPGERIAAIAQQIEISLDTTNSAADQALATRRAFQELSSIQTAELQQQLIDAEKVLQLVLLLELGLRSNQVNLITIYPEQFSIFYYIQSLHIALGAAQPPILLVGLLPRSIDMASVPIDLPSGNQVARIVRDTELFYRPDDPLPRLHVRGTCYWNDRQEVRQNLFDDWPQKPSHFYDLEVMLGLGKQLGTIQTREREKSLRVIQGQHLIVHLPEQPASQIYETTISSTAAPQVQVWRIHQQTEPSLSARQIG